MSENGRAVAVVAMITVGAAGAATVMLHAVAGPGSLACCSMHPLVEWTIPVVAGLLLGVPMGLLLETPSASGGAHSQDPACPSCGSEVRVGWRLCPECGNILIGDSA